MIDPALGRGAGTAGSVDGGGLVLSAPEVARIHAQLDRYPWYREALETYRARVEELIARAPQIPVRKGRAFFESCPVDDSRLLFDPYDPHVHRCPTCGREQAGESFDLAWVRQFQEWLGKRLVEAGILYALERDERHARCVRDALAHFVRRYLDYPLANNLLGPTRLFQSTYLEAFWLVDMVAAYDLTRASPAYDEADHRGVRDLLYASCEVVRSYDEGVSNRQAFNNAGMGAVGLLYDDAELVEHVLEGPHGFRFHMRESLLEDGIWYEGETYHFATLDHTLNLAEMARHRGIDLYHGASGHPSLRPMFDGPLKVLLPDLTFPARKDSWYGRGAGYHRDVYELGFARYGDLRYGGLLAHAYAHGDERTRPSWRTFLYLDPDLPELVPDGRAKPSREVPDRTVRPADIRPRSGERMPGTGVAVLRREEGTVYAGLEYGHYGGGHGHPDRLHLTLFADGVHWSADPGTGWYHVPELGWYRSTLAHATVSVDGRLQRPREGRLLAFGEAGPFAAAQARVEGVAAGVDLRRTLLLADGFLVDLVDVEGAPGGRHTFDWAFHTEAHLSFAAGDGADAGAPGPPPVLGDRDGYEFLSDIVPLTGTELTAIATHEGKELRILQAGAARRFVARSPGIPLRSRRQRATLIARRKGDRARFATLWAWGAGRAGATLADGADGLLRVEFAGRLHRIQVDDDAGLAVVRSCDDEIDALAVFGLRTVRFAAGADGGPTVDAVALASDRPIAAAALWREGDAWHADLPTPLGRIDVTGLPATHLVGLPEDAVRHADGRLRLQGTADPAVWIGSGDETVLHAGGEAEILVDVASAGAEVRPTADLPADWRLVDVTREPAPAGAAGAEGPPAPERWRLRVDLPGTPRETRGEFTVEVEGRRFAFPYRIEAPVATEWCVRSANGDPEVVLEVRDRTGRGGEVSIEAKVPWSPEGAVSRTVVVPPGGRSELRLPLPRTAPSAADRPGEDPGDAGTSGGWDLPGPATAGEHGVEARLDLGAFRGTTRARLPLHWAQPEGASTPNPRHDLRLDGDEQALWADRPWRGPDDASARGRVSWTEEGLRLVCDVRDDRLVTDASDEDLYENDSLQVYFDLRSGHHGDGDFAPGVAAYVLAPAPDGRTVRVAPIAGNREISNRGARAGWFTAEGVVADFRQTEEGYRIEASFPYASLGVDPLGPGDVIGFDLALSDNDGTWYRNTMLLWSGSRGRRLYIRGSYHDPRQYGWLVIADATDGNDRG